jgi:hypothetical protein
MTNPFLKLEMQGTEFVITVPGTSYQVTFRQLADYRGSALHTIWRTIGTLLSLGRSSLPALGESVTTRRASLGGLFDTQGLDAVGTSTQFLI